MEYSLNYRCFTNGNQVPIFLSFWFLKKPFKKRTHPLDPLPPANATFALLIRHDVYVTPYVTVIFRIQYTVYG